MFDERCDSPADHEVGRASYRDRPQGSVSGHAPTHHHTHGSTINLTRPRSRVPAWFQLGHGFSAAVSRQRRRHGLDRPPRFLVLAPLAAPGKFRQTLCAGDFVDGRAVIDYGLISDDLRAELEAGCARLLGGLQ